jgi:multicomponent Na+:H+ antiporter subunit G
MSGGEVATAVLLVLSAVFFLAGTVGLLRFPDVHSRLHALTKADNLGLGLVVVALLVQSGSVGSAAKLIMIWLLVLVASATACHLVAREAQHGSSPEDATGHAEPVD